MQNGHRVFKNLGALTDAERLRTYFKVLRMESLGLAYSTELSPQVSFTFYFEASNLQSSCLSLQVTGIACLCY